MAIKYRLIAFDLDETVLNHGAGPSPAVEQALQRAHGMGCTIAVCTGRPEMLIPDSILNLPIIDHIVSANGAVVRHTSQSGPMSVVVLPHKTVKDICALAKKSRAGMQICTPAHCYMDIKSWLFMRRNMKDIDRTESFWQGWKRMRHLFTICPSFFFKRAIKRGDVIKIICVYKDAAACRKQMAVLANNIDVEIASVMGYDIEIAAKGVTKGAMLKMLCHEIGIDKSEVFAVGDSDNDLSMRDAAGYLVAMGNASAGLKAVADYVTEDVLRDGAASAINRFVCGLQEGEKHGT